MLIVPYYKLNNEQNEGVLGMDLGMNVSMNDELLLSDTLKEMQKKTRIKRRLYSDRIEDLNVDNIQRVEYELSTMFKMNLSGKVYHYVGDIVSPTLFTILNKFTKYGYVYITKPFTSNVFDDTLFIVTLPCRLIRQNFNMITYIDFVYSVYGLNSYFLTLLERTDDSLLSNYRTLLDNMDAERLSKSPQSYFI